MTDKEAITVCNGREKGEEGDSSKRKHSSSDDEMSDKCENLHKMAKPSAKENCNEKNMSGPADTGSDHESLDSDSEMEEEEETEISSYQQQNKKNKQTKRRGPHPRTPENRRCEFPVVMKDEGSLESPATLTGMGIKLRTKTLENQFGPLYTITQTRNDSFLIGCRNKDQQSKVAKCKSLTGGIPVSCRIPTPWTEGVVYGISPTEKVTINDIEVVINNTQVKGLARFASNIITRTGQESHVLKIRFNLEQLPKEVVIHKTILPVYTYVAHVPRCTICNKLGHTKSKCKKKILVCSLCGSKDHSKDSCTNTKHCINCGGNHSASYQKCPKLLILKKANQIRSETYMSKAEAIRQAKELKDTPTNDFDLNSEEMPALPTSSFLKSPLVTDLKITYASVSKSKPVKTRKGSDTEKVITKENPGSQQIVSSKPRQENTQSINLTNSCNSSTNANELKSIRDSIVQLQELQKTMLERLEQDRIERSQLSDKIADACIQTLQAQDSNQKSKKQMFIEEVLKCFHKNKNSPGGKGLLTDLATIYDNCDKDSGEQGIIKISQEAITLSTICSNPCLSNDALISLTQGLTNNV